MSQRRTSMKCTKWIIVVVGLTYGCWLCGMNAMAVVDEGAPETSAEPITVTPQKDDFKEAQEKVMRFLDSVSSAFVLSFESVSKSISSIVGDFGFSFLKDVLRSTMKILREMATYCSKSAEVSAILKNLWGLLILLCYAGFFCGLFLLASFVPGVLNDYYSSLNKMAQTQLKVFFVVLLALTVYVLRLEWWSWLLAFIAGLFYYWSGQTLPITVTKQYHPSSKKTE